MSTRKKIEVFHYNHRRRLIHYSPSVFNRHQLWVYNTLFTKKENYSFIFTVLSHRGYILTVNVYDDRSGQLDGVGYIGCFADKCFAQVLPTHLGDSQSISYSCIAYSRAVRRVLVVSSYVPHHSWQRMPYTNHTTLQITICQEPSNDGPTYCAA